MRASFSGSATERAGQSAHGTLSNDLSQSYYPDDGSHTHGVQGKFHGRGARKEHPRVVICFSSCARGTEVIRSGSAWKEIS